MDAQHLAKLVEDGKYYELMLCAAKLWLENCHPEAGHAAVYAFHRDDTPPVRVTIPASSSACSAH